MRKFGFDARTPPIKGAHPVGHYSAAFTLDTYGHLMDRLPVRPVEWIDDVVFPQGAVAALKLHSYSALQAATAGHAVQSADCLKASNDADSDNLVQSGAAGCVVGGAGFEPACCPHQPVPIDDDDLLGTA